jgi:hypothetical protein
MEQQQPFNSLARGPRFSRSMLAFLAFLGIALFFLLSEHRAHALGYLPLILLLACPFLHMFHHGGHGGHGGHSGRHSGHDAQPTGRGDGTRERNLSEEII